MPVPPKPLNLLRKELFNVRLTWKKENRRKGSRGMAEANGVSFIDGIVFGLTLALNVIDGYRRQYR